MERILAAVDLSDATADVVAMAVAISQREHARLCFVYVEPQFPPTDCAVWGEAEPLAPAAPPVTEALERIRNDVEQRGIEVSCLRLQGSPAEKLQEVARAFRPDLVVFGGHARGALERLFQGSVRDRFLSQTPCPVLVVPHRGAA